MTTDVEQLRAKIRALELIVQGNRRLVEAVPNNREHEARLRSSEEELEAAKTLLAAKLHGKAPDAPDDDDDDDDVERTADADPYANPLGNPYEGQLNPYGGDDINPYKGQLNPYGDGTDADPRRRR